MSAKKPIVLTNGQYTQIQSGDFVDTPNGGTGAITPAGARANIGSPNTIDIYSAFGSAIKAEPLYGSLLTSGISSVSMTNLRVNYLPFYLPVAVTLTGVGYMMQTAGAYTASGYNGIGICTVSGGTYTLVASSTNDSTIWKTTANIYTQKNFSSTYSANAGMYMLAFLYNNSVEVTTPKLYTIASASLTLAPFDFSNGVKIPSFIGSQSSIPTSQAASGTTGGGQFYAFSIY